MQTTQEPSTFAQIIDKLRDKSEAELKQLYLQFFKEDLTEEWKEITSKADFGDSERENGKTKKKKPKKENGLKTVFGIWKDETISLDSIRQQAWQREK